MGQKLKEKINEVISLASEDPSQMRWGKTLEITDAMNLEELNKLDETIILTKTDFEKDPPENSLVATVVRINWRKIDLFIEEIYHKAEDFEFGLKLNQLLGQCFFRRWTLHMAESRLKKKAEEIDKNPEVSSEIKSTLHLARGLVLLKIVKEDYRSFT